MSALRLHGISLYKGKGPLSSRCFQVCTLGDITSVDIARFLKIVESVQVKKQGLTQRTEVICNRGANQQVGVRSDPPVECAKRNSDDSSLQGWAKKLSGLAISLCWS